MITQILIALGATLVGLLLVCIICTFACVKKVQRLYDDLENIDPEAWKEDKDQDKFDK